MTAVLSINQLNKIYADGFQALKNINLTVSKGEIFALLGPNGAGKTTLINIICGIVNPTSGQVLVDGCDIVKDYRTTRSLIGLVPQEIVNEAFEKVWDTVCFSRELFGKAPDDLYIEKILRQLSLWDKRNNKIMTLSGGMKRRVMLAKALSHEPMLLFLDEPTAGVDVNLRQDMWKKVHDLKKTGVTIILTTHYIEEAEEMADRIGVINNGEIIVVEEKNTLIKKLGGKQLILDLKEPIKTIPENLSSSNMELNLDGSKLIYNYNSNNLEHNIADLLAKLSFAGISYSDIHTKQVSLEEIFIKLVGKI